MRETLFVIDCLATILSYWLIINATMFREWVLLVWCVFFFGYVSVGDLSVLLGAPQALAVIFFDPIRPFVLRTTGLVALITATFWRKPSE